MALNLLHLCTLSACSTSLFPARLAACRVVRRRVVSVLTPEPPTAVTTRRSANYRPSICNNDFIQSLSSDNKSYVKRVGELKPCVVDLLRQEKNDLVLLELIDTLERLGLGPLFDREITGALNKINGQPKEGKDLHFTALLFRLSRQRGQMITPDVFSSFMNEKGAFKECFSEDAQVNLSLYEASSLCLEGETVLDEARVFSTRNLKRHLKAGGLKENIRTKVEHALELPYHWRMPRLEASWFITNAYTNEENMNPKLLELAKLDYNTRQATYQTDIKAASSWWSSRGVAKRLSFSRDRLAECFLWALAKTDDPQTGYSREVMSLVNQFISTIDDIYDVYGTLDELELFTDIVDRWDVHDIEKLPEYMRLCFLALFNFVNDMGYNTLKEQGCNSVPFLSRLWAGLCKGYLLEARWYNNGYTPTLDQYLNNAIITISAPVILGSQYCSMNQEVTKERLETLINIPDLIKCSSTILRLCNDLGTSKDEMGRGDVGKSIQCYMHETGATEEEARQHVRDLISDTWKKMNKHLIMASPFSREFVLSAMGLARMSHSYYYHGNDDFGGKHGGRTLVRFKQLVAEPIPL